MYLEESISVNVQEIQLFTKTDTLGLLMYNYCNNIKEPVSGQ